MLHQSFLKFSNVFSLVEVKYDLDLLTSIGLLVIAIILIIYLTGKVRINAFLVLLAMALFVGIGSGLGLIKTVTTIAKGFGATMEAIGIVIAFGTILGKVLEKSGGAVALAESVLKLIGRKRVAEAMNILGYIVSIPVFCDSGFLIINPLNKALSKLANVSLGVTAIALSTGLYATHTLVPPTPGPLGAAANLGADLGLVVGLGLVVAAPASIAGLLYAKVVGSRIWIEPKISESYEEIKAKLGKLPSAKIAFAAIITPVILIVLKSVAEFPTAPLGVGLHVEFIRFIGHPIIALLIGTLISFKLAPKIDISVYGPEGWVGEGLRDSAIIILITAAGGSLGFVIRETGLGQMIGGALGGVAGSKFAGLLIAFVIAALLKTAQGSSTVSLITTSALMAPLLGLFGLDTAFGKVLTVLAIGAGSMVVSHANDSYFWVVTLFSDMDVVQGYKLQTLGTLVEGLVAIATVMILSVFLL